MADPVPLGELVRGPIAHAMLRSLMRDLNRQARDNGATVPAWALPVYQALEAASGEVVLRPSTVVAVSGHAFANVGSTEWTTVAVAAQRTGLSERHVRRLAQSGQVRATRFGGRSWQIDLESLQNVLRKAA